MITLKIKFNMHQKIKLIWDFMGSDAEQTAKHHKIHLAEFAENKKLLLNITDVEQLNENHFIAYLMVDESEVFSIRDSLKPVRAEIVED